MASLTKESDRGRQGLRLRFYLNRKRKSLYLGKISKRNAETVKRHIEELVHAIESNTKPDAETVRWANGLEGRMRETLENWKLIQPLTKSATSVEKTLGPFLDQYIAGRTDVSAATREKYGHTKRFLVGKFGADHQLDTITKADAKAWQRWLMEQPARIDKDGKVVRTMAPSTASKHVKRAKTMFAEAVDAELIPSNPMDAIKGGEEVNRSRDHFVDRQSAKQVLDACPDIQWRLIFALARYGGLRRCEITALKWSDVQWDQSSTTAL
ncbi:phage integrase, partial [Rhodopirellula baltica SH28]